MCSEKGRVGVLKASLAGGTDKRALASEQGAVSVVSMMSFCFPATPIPDETLFAYPAPLSVAFHWLATSARSQIGHLGSGVCSRLFCAIPRMLYSRLATHPFSCHPSFPLRHSKSRRIATRSVMKPSNSDCFQNIRRCCRLLDACDPARRKRQGTARRPPPSWPRWRAFHHHPLTTLLPCTGTLKDAPRLGPTHITSRAGPLVGTFLAVQTRRSAE